MLSNNMETAVALDDIRFRFGQPESLCLEGGGSVDLSLKTPLLGGPDAELLLKGEVERSGSAGDIFKVVRCPESGSLAGIASRQCHGPAEAHAFDFYRELLRLTQGLEVYRVWNFVPDINAETDGLEHYRSFNIGRYRAFQDLYGEDAMEAHLPAASAVGTGDDCISVAFLAGKSPVTFFENPEQVPAYRYPAEYGPRSPSFARGAVVEFEDRRIGYLSGTSSIRGHETIGEGNLDLQFETTMNNIRSVLERMGFDGAVEPNAQVDSSYRIYIRHPEDFERVRERFFDAVGESAAERTIFLQADICRAPLKLEIEGAFIDPDSTGSGR